MIILTGKTDSYAQFITVLLIFVAVLAVTALVTKWIAGYQKQQGAAGNIEVLETVRQQQIYPVGSHWRKLFCDCGLQRYRNKSGRNSCRAAEGQDNNR